MNKETSIQKHIRTIGKDFVSADIHKGVGDGVKAVNSCIRYMREQGEIVATGEIGPNNAKYYRINPHYTTDVNVKVTKDFKYLFIYGGNARRMADNQHYEGIE